LRRTATFSESVLSGPTASLRKDDSEHYGLVVQRSTPERGPLTESMRATPAKKGKKRPTALKGPFRRARPHGAWRITLADHLANTWRITWRINRRQPGRRQRIRRRRSQPAAVQAFMEKMRNASPAQRRDYINTIPDATVVDRIRNGSKSRTSKWPINQTSLTSDS